MRDIIKNFYRQFEFEPRIENKKNLRKHKKFIVAGMGGSHLAADLINAWDPSCGIIIHKDYALPPIPKSEFKDYLFIASSYSGNTEEVIDAFEAARKMKLSLAAVSIGGKLLELADKCKIPYVKLPDGKVEPRLAVGLSSKSMLALMGEKKGLREASEMASLLRPIEYEARGKELAKIIKGHVPIIYSSNRNYPIAYNWKIKFNETSKIAAFCNAFPELNHNEMIGFDVRETTKSLMGKFCFIFLRDSEDHPKIQKRMEILKKMLNERKFMVDVLELEGKTRFHKIFSSLVLADWTSYYTALEYNIDPMWVPMVEEFKKLVK